MTLDFLRPLLTWRNPAPSTGGMPPSPRDMEELRLLRDDQLRWYVSQHGQFFLRRELQRRARR
jgi:hypothetical protein